MEIIRDGISSMTTLGRWDQSHNEPIRSILDDLYKCSQLLSRKLTIIQYISDQLRAIRRWKGSKRKH